METTSTTCKNNILFLAAAVSAGVECWVYLSNVEKRDKKTEALVKKVGSAATWAKYEGFPELRDAVFSSFVDFLDKRHLLVVSDFDVMACPQARMEDISTERVSWYLEMLHRHGKKSLPLDAHRVGIARPQPRSDKGGFVCEGERLDFLVAVCRVVQGSDADVEPGTWRTGA